MKSFKRTAMIFFLLLLVATMFIQCSSDDEEDGEPSFYTVTYNGNGSTGGILPVDARDYKEGETVTVPASSLATTQEQDGIVLIFKCWNTALDGSGTYYSCNPAGTDTFSMGTGNVTLYAQWSVIRGTGPGGGLVFYDAGSVQGWGRYLEVAPSDQSTSAIWGCSGTLITGADGIVVGTGEQNTTDIETGCTTAGTAADLCANLTLGGETDWFLPSKDELQLIYDNLKLYFVGNLINDYYLSSSENNADTMHNLMFNNSSSAWSTSGKGVGFRVRAVRGF
jgi:List-Bact-rpt repeat protein